jgi:uncharacterized protein
MRVMARRTLAVALVAVVATVASGQDAPPIARYVPSGPDPRHVFVLDSAHLLSVATLQALQDSARALQTETAADVVWVTLPTLGGRPIEEAALYIGRTWRIGSAGKPGDPLRNRGLVILFIPDKTTTAGSNFRIEVGNGLEGTITDSRSRSISAAMRTNLRAKRYDDAYMAGWAVAATLVREDFATHGDAGRAAAANAAAARHAPVEQSVPVPREFASPAALVFQVLFFALIGVLLIALVLTRWRRPARPSMMFPVNSGDDDEPTRRTPWFTASSGSDSSDSGSSSSSDGGSFGDGGGFSGGGSSDTI